MLGEKRMRRMPDHRDPVGSELALIHTPGSSALQVEGPETCAATPDLEREGLAGLRREGSFRFDDACRFGSFRFIGISGRGRSPASDRHIIERPRRLGTNPFC